MHQYYEPFAETLSPFLQVFLIYPISAQPKTFSQPIHLCNAPILSTLLPTVIHSRLFPTHRTLPAYPLALCLVQPTFQRKRHSRRRSDWILFTSIRCILTLTSLLLTCDSHCPYRSGLLLVYALLSLSFRLIYDYGRTPPSGTTFCHHLRYPTHSHIP